MIVKFSFTGPIVILIALMLGILLTSTQAYVTKNPLLIKTWLLFTGLFVLIMLLLLFTVRNIGRVAVEI